MSRNRYALVIGCAYYANKYGAAKITKSVPQLNATITDATDMYNFLVNDYKYSTTFMTDDLNYSSPLFPTYNNIYNQIRTILTKAQSTDDVVIYYAGHGTQLPANSGNTEELDGRDEAIVPADYQIGADLMSDDVLNTLLRQFGKKSTRIFCVFDCCHSGTMCDMKYTYSYDSSKKTFTTDVSRDSPYTKLPLDANVLTLSGCRDDEVSWEDVIKFDKSNKTQGILTSAFIYVCKTNPRVTKDIFNIVQDMDQYTSKYNQHPRITSNIDIMVGANATYKTIFNGASYLIEPQVQPQAQPQKQAQVQPTNQKVPLSLPVKPSITIKPSRTSTNSSSQNPSMFGLNMNSLSNMPTNLSSTSFLNVGSAQHSIGSSNFKSLSQQNMSKYIV